MSSDLYKVQVRQLGIQRFPDLDRLSPRSAWARGGGLDDRVESARPGRAVARSARPRSQGQGIGRPGGRPGGPWPRHGVGPGLSFRAGPDAHPPSKQPMAPPPTPYLPPSPTYGRRWRWPHSPTWLRSGAGAGVSPAADPDDGGAAGAQQIVLAPAPPPQITVAMAPPVMPTVSYAPVGGAPPVGSAPPSNLFTQPAMAPPAAAPPARPRRLMTAPVTMAPPARGASARPRRPSRPGSDRGDRPGDDVNQPQPGRPGDREHRRAFRPEEESPGADGAGAGHGPGPGGAAQAPIAYAPVGQAAYGYAPVGQPAYGYAPVAAYAPVTPEATFFALQYLPRPVQVSRRALPRPRAPVCSSPSGPAASPQAGPTATPPHPPHRHPGSRSCPGSGISDQRSDDPPAGDPPAHRPSSASGWLAGGSAPRADEPGRNPRRLGSGEGEPGTLGSNALEGRGSSRRRADQGLAWKCIDVARWNLSA